MVSEGVCSITNIALNFSMNRAICMDALGVCEQSMMVWIECAMRKKNPLAEGHNMLCAVSSTMCRCVLGIRRKHGNARTLCTSACLCVCEGSISSTRYTVHAIQVSTGNVWRCTAAVFGISPFLFFFAIRKFSFAQWNILIIGCDITHNNINRKRLQYELFVVRKNPEYNFRFAADSIECAIIIMRSKKMSTLFIHNLACYDSKYECKIKCLNNDVILNEEK